MAKMFRTWLAAPALRVVFSPHPQNRAAMGRWGWFCHRNNDKSHSGHRPPPVRSALRELTTTDTAIAGAIRVPGV